MLFILKINFNEIIEFARKYPYHIACTLFITLAFFYMVWLIRKYPSIPTILSKSLKQFALSTWITALSIALAGGLLMAIFMINTQSYKAFTGGSIGFDAVLGARGSHLQLVLNTVFHLETSPGNIPWSLYENISKDPRVSLAIPYAVGDNYYGFRIVGTTEEIFTKFFYQENKKFEVKKGRFFDSKRREAVIGSYVAKQTGLKVGSILNPYHGFLFNEASQHEEKYLVTGILETTNSPSDRIILIPIDGVFRMSGHVLRGSGEQYEAQPGETIDDEHKEVSAIMLKLKDPMSGFSLQQTINKQGKVASLAWPIQRVMADFFNKMGWMNKILEFISYLVALVAAGSIVASLYNTMNERKREFAILRALGAKKTIIFNIIILQSTVIALIGSIISFAVMFAIMFLAKIIISSQVGVVLSIFEYNDVLFFTPIGLIFVGALSGVIPAIKAYKTDIANNLLPVS